jgi:hypothetical protein
MRGIVDPERLAEVAKQRVQFFQKVVMLSLERTTVNDWVNQNGKPYLQSSGAEKLIGLWGIYIKDTDCSVTIDEETGLPSFEFTGTVGSRVIGTEMDVIGGRSGSDDFFAGTECKCGHKRAEHQGQVGSCEGKVMDQVCDCLMFQLKPRRVDPVDVKKAAYSNFLANAITRLLGMRNMTWDQVSDTTSGRISAATVAQVRYKVGQQASQDSQSRSQQHGTNGDTISVPQQKRLWAIAKNAGWKDEEIKALYQRHSYEHSRDIKKADYDAICHELEGGSNA